MPRRKGQAKTAVSGDFEGVLELKGAISKFAFKARLGIARIWAWLLKCSTDGLKCRTG